MKFIFIFFVITFSLSANEEGLSLLWQDFKSESKLQTLPFKVTSKELNIIFGRSYDIYDIERYCSVKQVVVEGDKVKIFIDFPKIIFDLDDIEKDLQEGWVTNSKIVTDIEVDLSKSYTVEFYGSEPTRNINGKVIKPGEEPRKFAELSFVPLKKLLAAEKEKRQFAKVANQELSKFLTMPVKSEEILKANNLEELLVAFRQILKENKYDLALVENFNEEEDSENKKLFVSLKSMEINFEELVVIIAIESGLYYRIDAANIIFASQETFLISEAIQQKKNLKLPGLEADMKEKVLTLDAKICLQSGILEFLMCLPNSFEHESVFMTNVKPEYIHMGLLIIGAEPLPVEERTFEKKAGNKSYLDVQVQWTIDGKTTKVPLNELIIDRSKKDEKEKKALDSWFFAGSFFTENNIYAANLHKSVVSIQQHPASVIYYGEETDDPYRSDEFGFKVNQQICPPVDTPVKFIIKLK